MNRPDTSRFVFTDTPTISLDDRLEAMEEANNEDDVPFLVAAVRYWRDEAKRLRKCLEEPADQ